MDRLPIDTDECLKERVLDMPVDTTINTFHCKEGKDNDRLYITRFATHWLGYCHHCGYRGYWNQGLGFNKKRSGGRGSVQTLDSKQQPVETLLPKGRTHVHNKWPKAAKLWHWKARLTKEKALEYGLRWLTKEKRMFIPILQGENLVGFNTRSVNDPEDPIAGLKYKTKNFFPGSALFHHIVGDGETVVFVEDQLSAIRVREATGYDTIAILGSSFKEDGVLYVARKNYKQAYIFLDNDNVQVKKLQRTLAKNIRNYVGKVRTLTNHSIDPKSMSDKQILRELLDMEGVT